MYFGVQTLEENAFVFHMFVETPGNLDAVRELTGQLAEETGIAAFATVTSQPAALPSCAGGEPLPLERHDRR
ncbi:hypothetical protein [Streptomyces sp. NPDC047042]|uniref:hypothetical protein n=1 Tax=Streptomyces sp. NPDC047042 TaxID=3154807 RepID=UPI0033F6008D